MVRSEYWRLSSFYFSFYALLGAFVPYRGRYLAEQGFDSLTIGISMAVISACTVFSPLMWAVLAERYQWGRKLLIIGSVLTLFSIISVYYQTVAVLMIVSAAAYSIAWNAIGPQSEALTLSRVKASGGDYNRIRLWGSIGYIITVLLVGYGVQYMGVRTVVPVSIVAIVALIVVSYKLPDFSPASRLPKDKTSLWQAATAPGTALILLACVLVSASHTPFHTFFDLYLRGNGYPASVSGWLITLGVLAEIVLFFFAKRLLALFSFQPLFIAAMLLAGIRWLLLAYGVQWWGVLIVVQLLHAISFALMHSLAMHALHSAFPSAMHGRAQALYGTLAYGIGGVGGNLLAGWIWQDGAGGRHAFLLSALYCFAAFTIVVIYRRRISLS